MSINYSEEDTRGLQLLSGVSQKNVGFVVVGRKW